MSANSGVVPVTSTPVGQLGAQVVDQVGGALVGRAERRLRLEDAAARRRGVTTGGVTAAMSSRASSSCGERGDLGVARPRSRSTTHGERAVGARAVLVGDQVVGLAGGQARSAGCRASCGQVRMPRAGSGEQSAARRRRRAPTASGRRPTRLAQRAVSGCSRCDVAALADLAGQQPAAGEAAQRGHQGERGGQHRDDGDRGGEAERRRTSAARPGAGPAARPARSRRRRPPSDRRWRRRDRRPRRLSWPWPEELDVPGDAAAARSRCRRRGRPWWRPSGRRC